MKYLKHILIILIIFPVLFTMTGCWDNTEIDDMAYVISLGLDSGTQNKIELSLLIAIPKKIKPGGGSWPFSLHSGSQASGSESSQVVTVDAPTIPAGLNLINTFVARRISLAHLKAVVFSEELARKGVGEYLDYFDRDREVRSTADIIISRTSADKFLRSLKPVLETNPSKYIELTAMANSYTAFIPYTKMGRFISASISYDEQPIAVLGGVNNNALNVNAPIPYEEPFRPQPGSSDTNEGEYLPGNIPRKGDVERELMGSAVFDGDRMTGEFNAAETAVMLMIRGEFNRNFWSIEDPEKKGSFVPVDIRQSRSPSISLKRQGNKYNIDVGLHLSGSILEVESDIQYENENNMVTLEGSIAKYITSIADEVIKTAQKEYKSDVFKFGNYARGTFWLEDDFEKSNWKSAFCNATVKVETDFRVTRSGQLYKTNPIINSGGIQQD